MYLQTYRWIDEAQFVEMVTVYVEFYNRVIKRYGEKIPMPPTQTLRQVGSIIAAIDEPVFGVAKYPSFETKVAVAYYEINKGHYFYNGNKRLATYTLLYLLRLNGYTLPWGEGDFVNLALRVARSRGTTRSRTLWINRIRAILEIEAEHWTYRLRREW